MENPKIYILYVIRASSDQTEGRSPEVDYALYSSIDAAMPDLLSGKYAVQGVAAHSSLYLRTFHALDNGRVEAKDTKLWGHHLSAAGSWIYDWTPESGRAPAVDPELDEYLRLREKFTGK